RIVVAHPRDADGDMLLRHLQRLGCRVDHLWPTADQLDAEADVVFCLIEPETRPFCASLMEKAHAALVGIVDPAHPRSMQLLTDVNPLAVLTKPVDAAALLTNLVVARNNSRYQRRLQSKISKLEETLRSVRKVERAKTILMEQRHIDESGLCLPARTGDEEARADRRHCERGRRVERRSLRRKGLVWSVRSCSRLQLRLAPSRTAGR
ncbi:MAG: ANTAR domain-containing response regulator, partial [Dongiaceae bacterium]